MKIVNITFNNARGGVEQAFVDYTNTLITHEHEVYCIIPKNTGFLEDLVDITNQIKFSRFLRTKFLKPLLYIELFFILRTIKPELIVFHNERNIKIVKRIAKNTPVVAINHGGKTKHMLVADHILSVNTAIKNRLIAAGFDGEKITVIGNMISL